MAPAKSKNTVGLGRSIINQKARDLRQSRESNSYSTDLDATDRLKSVTQERDLDEFLNTAQLAGTEFTAEKQNIRVIQAPGMGASSAHNPFLLSVQEEKDTLQKHSANKNRLRVPRRPPWTKAMKSAHAQLERQEKDAFLTWRRDLAELQEKQDLLLTPFERNIEVWRQLWRVLERSHLVVQIVDARNPLRFRCEDLEAYVQDVEGAEGEAGTGKGKRRSLLLINKSDLLTRNQRLKWADYFDSQGIKYAFYSAAMAAAVQEAKRAQSETEDEEESEESKEEIITETAANMKPEDTAVSQETEQPSQEAEAIDAAEGSEDAEDDDSASESEDSQLAEKFKFVADDQEEDDTDPRTKVLTVQELEDLFIESAPDLSEFPQNGVPPTKLVVGLVGYPNVGKSSTINSLLGAKKVSVSATPGKTKHFQTIHLTPTIVLCDCPGLVFPQFATTKAHLICDGVLPIDQMREYLGPVGLVAKRVKREVLEAVYGLTIRRRTLEEGGDGISVSPEDLLIAYAVARGFTRAGQGNPDEARAARYILKDYMNAKILFCNPPPGISEEEFNEETRANALRRLDVVNKKRAPVTRVTKKADTFVPPAGGQPNDPDGPTGALPPQSQKSRAIDASFFATGSSLSSRPFVQGSSRHGKEFTRGNVYPHQNSIGDNGTPLSGRRARIAAVINASGGEEAKGKKHFKANKKIKQRSGKGYDD